MSAGLGRHLLTGGSLSSLSLYRQTAACCFFAISIIVNLWTDGSRLMLKGKLLQLERLAVLRRCHQRTSSKFW